MNLRFKSEFITGYSIPANHETRKFLEENGIVSNHEKGWLDSFLNPDPEKVRLVFAGTDTRPLGVALVGTMAFHKGSIEWRWWQNSKREGRADPDLPNLEEREDGLYAV